MKLKLNRIKFKRLFELQLIKAKTYEQFIKETTTSPDSDLSSFLVNFKKAIQIIFKFHKKKQFILFIGPTPRIEKMLNLKTPHSAISNKFNSKNLSLNNILAAQIIKDTKKKSVLKKLKKKPNLIVIFTNYQYQYTRIMQESYSYKIPFITFSNTFKEHHKKRNYAVPGNFESKQKYFNSIFFSLIKKMLK